jgi:hypothetical protein
MNVASCLGRRGGRTLCRAPAIGGSKGRGLLASRSCCSPAGGLLTMERGHRGGARAHGAGEGAGLGVGWRKKGLGAMERSTSPCCCYRGRTAARGRRRQGGEKVAAREKGGVGVKNCQVSTPIYRRNPRVRVS